YELKVCSINNFEETVFLHDVPEDVKQRNIKNVKYHFSEEEKLVQDWEKYFNNIIYWYIRSIPVRRFSGT
ncbi:hypothetical protein P9764_16135, partial [Bacillus smithii]|uniref:hypothetical protein n=1 Tax=Bacillus smithii TaxID=1479 RepID=UPI002E1D7F84|nr:hypothetical protein [Bacillus smithii]